MKSIFDIKKELEQLEALESQNETIDKETGELIFEESEALKELKEELEKEGIDKAEKYRYVILKLTKDVELAVDEIKRIQSYKKRVEKNIETVKELLKYLMDYLKTNKITFKNGASISLSKTKTYIYDEEILSKKHLNLFDVVTKLDKIEAKKLFKQGLIKEGIVVEKKDSLRIK